MAAFILTPQASAAKPDISDVLTAIANAVTTIQNSISSSQTNIQNSIASSETNVGTVHSVALEQISIDPYDASGTQIDIFDERTGLSHSGHISFNIAGPLGINDDENTFIIACLTSSDGDFVQTAYTASGGYDQDFSCQQLSINVLDNSVGTDAGPVTVSALAQYTVSNDITTITQADLP